MPLSQPPRDDDGAVVPHDHSEIKSQDRIIRRISHEQVVLGRDGQTQRISSMAYAPSDGNNGGMSVDLETQILEAGLNPVTYVTSPRWVGSVWFTAGALRAESLQVGYDPIDSNPHHGEVWGTKPRSKKRRLSELAQWYVEIPNVLIRE